MKLDKRHWVAASSLATLLVFNSQGTLAEVAAGPRSLKK